MSVFIKLDHQVLLKGSKSFAQQTIENRALVPCLFLRFKSVVTQSNVSGGFLCKCNVHLVIWGFLSLSLPGLSNLNYLNDVD